jgi:ubiquinone/menaquinone biosynthesis C-methylase UbiE
MLFRKTLSTLFKSLRLFSYNSIERDRWIQLQAGRIIGGSIVLDVGAGSCPYRKFFSHCVYKTQDFVQLRSDQLRDGNYGNIDYVCDARNIPVPDGEFDVVLSTEMLEHVPEPGKVVAEFSRILKPGGKLILTAPLSSGIHQEPYHYYGGFTPYWYQHFLKEAGFADIVVQPNEGSFKFYSQESIRFLRSSTPFKLSKPFLLDVFWAPFWIIFLPLLGLMIPIICHLLDRFDREKRFTVGYHVVATKP